MPLLFNTKINYKGNWKMTPEDARELARCLTYAAEESEHHDAPWTLEIYGVDCDIKKFKMIVFKEKEAQEQTFAPQENPKKQQTVDVEKEQELNEECPLCKGKIIRSWFGFGKQLGCGQSLCNNYYKKDK